MDFIGNGFRLMLFQRKLQHVTTVWRRRRSVTSRSNIKELISTASVKEDRTRNIGILAHIDAGKTTTTERMLHASGLTRHCGNVDSGDTVMDFLPQERERGITINSATITFPWKGYRINLIDTPGHVDFTVEVERTLLAMDGVVIVLDASKGVQAQTQTVWRQAVKFGLPSLIYLNKMDKPGANVDKCLEQLRSKLGLVPLPLQIPIGTGKSFRGAINILHLEAKDTSAEAAGTSQNTTMNTARRSLLEQLSELDDEFADLYLNDPESLDSETIESEIHEYCLSRKLSPLLMGSSLRNYGIDDLLDAVVKYLPNPREVSNPVVRDRLAASTGFCGLAFKNVHDRQRGLLTFLRLFRGNIKPGASLYNINKHKREKVAKVMEAYADELREIAEASEGNIAVISGLKETVTGDTLVGIAHPHAFLDEADTAIDQVPILRISDPVFFCSVEAESPSKQQALEDVLAIIQKEDPSVRVTTDPELGQLVISGMGELHLEIIRDRIKREFGLEVFFGILQVAYKETVSSVAEHVLQLTREIQAHHHRVDIHLRLIPAPQSGAFVRVRQVPAQSFDWSSVAKESVQAVNNGVAAGLSNGIVMGSPVIDVQVDLVKLEVTRGTPYALISAAASQCIRQILSTAHCYLLQPLMNVSITIPSLQVHDILADLAKRSAAIKEIEVVDEDTRCIVAECPLAEMTHFSRDIRTVSHGLASIDIQLGSYVPVDADHLSRIRSRGTY